MRRGRPARLLLLGVSVRALAASACRGRLWRERHPGGLIALDYFGDADLLDLARRRRFEAISLARDLRRPRSIPGLVRAALDLDWQALVYAGGLENRPGLLALLERRGALLGNDPTGVRRLRDPSIFFPFLRAAGLPHPPTWIVSEAARRRSGLEPPPAGAGRPLLWKRVRSGGGGGVQPARAGEACPRGHYLQELLPGRPGSIAFVADGQAAVVLGVSEQISGWADLGGSGFRYGGSIAGPPEDLLPPGALGLLEEAAGALTRRFGLRGLNGLDFVLSSGLPHLLEVNPRYTASMELLEEMGRVSLFDLHLEALAGRLPERTTRTGVAPPLVAALPESAPGDRDRLAATRSSASADSAGGRRFLAKGILYAEVPVRGIEPALLAELGARDLPIRGEAIGAGQPICTLMTEGDSPEACRDSLVAVAGRARSLIASAQRPSRQALPELRGTW
ncbi:MAG TPA: ATP-grasp domain-containing protein [Candidatus Polarisedimenticolia bacterium]|nr:ATP-grasp domain-containing protein [Candidatus Polarisedimenticolia bacterium]